MSMFDYTPRTFDEEIEFNGICALFMKRYCRCPYKSPQAIPAHFAVKYIAGRGVEVARLDDRWHRP